jgi:hypothetical protein
MITHYQKNALSYFMKGLVLRMDKDQYDLTVGIIDALVDINSSLREIKYMLDILHPIMENSSLNKIAKILENWERRT